MMKMKRIVRFGDESNEVFDRFDVNSWIIDQNMPQNIILLFLTENADFKMKISYRNIEWFQ